MPVIYDEVDPRQAVLIRIGALASSGWGLGSGAGKGRWFHSSIRPWLGQGVGAECPGTQSTSRPA